MPHSESEVALVGSNPDFLEGLSVLLRWNNIASLIFLTQPYGRNNKALASAIREKKPNLVVTGTKNRSSDTDATSGITLGKLLAVKSRPVLVASTSDFEEAVKKAGLHFVNNDQGAFPILTAIQTILGLPAR
jgi:hypothetical protein